MPLEIFSPENMDLVSWLNHYYRSSLIEIVGVCEAIFEGRAESTLEPGERILLIKKDSAFLLHDITGLKPVNWQGAHSRITFSKPEQGVLQVESRKKTNTQELVRVLFHEVFHAFQLSPDLVGRFQLYGSEFNVVAYLIDHPDLIEPGFQPVTTERQTDFGYIDIIGIDKNGVKTIVEVKRRQATPNDVQQLLRYLHFFHAKEKTDLRGILVAPDIGKKAFAFLRANGLDFRKVNVKDAIVSKRDQERNHVSLDEWLQ